jgi:hypothetical protein
VSELENATPTPEEGVSAQPEQNVQEQPEVNASTPQEFEIEGIGKLTPDQIKEYKQGYLRQSDYTRKTQELAQQRTEAKEAIELYNYLKNNPEIVQAMQNGDYNSVQGNPVIAKALSSNPQIEQMQVELASIRLDSEIARLKAQYSDFDEVSVIGEADKRGISDLEFVYKALQGEKLPNLKTELEKQIKSTITEEIRRNGLATSTIINSNDVPATNVADGLTPEELVIAQKMGIAPEKYAKAKQMG